MRIGIYNGISCHHEMIGYVLDYCLTRGYEPVVYSTVDHLGWIEFYRKMYPQFTVYSPQSFRLDRCDRVFLLTDDDYTFPDSLFLDGRDKIISIEHSSVKRRFSAKLYLGTRYFSDRPIPHCLPTFPIFSLEEKKQALFGSESDQQMKIIVSLIGSSIPTSLDQLSNLFSNFLDLEFHCISRTSCCIRNGRHSSSNISYFPNLTTIEMMKLLLHSDYILCLENKPDHEDKVISASIPLSFGVLSRLIIPRSWNRYYQFSSVLEFDSKTPIQLEKTIDLQSIEKERNNLIEQRNQVFDSFVI